MTVRVVSWNVAWGTKRSRKGRLATQVIRNLKPDIAAISETKLENYPELQVIDGGDDWGYRSVPGRRKIVLLSRYPWLQVTTYPCRPLAGRFVAGTTKTTIGELRVVGVCVPWFACHVSSGAKDRSNWDEFKAFVAMAKEALVEESGHGLPLLMAGDCNLELPSQSPRNPAAYHGFRDLLQSHELVLATGSLWDPGDDRALLNHIACRGLRPMRRHIWSKIVDGVEVSDHAGVYVDLKPSMKPTDKENT